MKNREKALSFKQLLLSAAVISACGSVAAQSPGAVSSEFTKVPQHLINETSSTSQQTAKPNILLYVDDSGSMASRVDRWTTRMQTVQNALNAVLNQYGDRMHWNLISLWNTANNPGTSGVVSRTPLTGEQVRVFVNRLRPSGATPTSTRYLTAADYADSAIKYQCQKNFIVVLSDGDANNDTARRVIDLASRSPLREFYRVGGSFVPSGYHPHWGGMGNGISHFSHRLFKADLRTSGTDAEGSAWDGQQNIQTYTVGFGGGISENGLKYLQAGGAAVGQSYFQADNSAALVAAFATIFSNINTQTQAAATTTSSTSTPSNASSAVDGVAATLNLDTGNWSSSFRFFAFDSKGTISDATLASNFPSVRRVIINDGTTNAWLEVSSSGRAAQFGFTNVSEFTNAFLPWYLRSGSISDTQAENNAVAAVRTSPTQARKVSKYRSRVDAGSGNVTNEARMMGDVLDSNAQTASHGKYLMVGANDGLMYFYRKNGRTYDMVLNYMPAAMEREGSTLAQDIHAIAESDYGQPSHPHIYGINGGMFITTTAATAGRHQQSILMSNMGQGGRGAFGLKVAGKGQNGNDVGLDAAPSDWLTSVPLWETEKGTGNYLGYTVGKPSMYQLATRWAGDKPIILDGVRLAGFLGNGYMSTAAASNYDSSPTLYVYDVLGEEIGTSSTASVSAGTPGNLIAKISTGSLADGAGALASPTVVDTNLDGVADIVYAGDYYGDLYRFDLRGDPGSWTVSKIFDGSPLRPITSAPAVYRNSASEFIVSFGTGSDVFDVDRTSQNRQALYGIYDKIDQPASTLKEADLLKQEFSSTTYNNTAYRQVSNKPLGAAHKGWYIELDEGIVLKSAGKTQTTSAEKVSSQPSILLSSVFFSTRIYQTESSSSGTAANNNIETCKALTTSQKSTGTSWLLGVDVKNGGPLTTATFTDPGFKAADAAAGQPDKAVVGLNLGVIAGESVLLSYKESLRGDQLALTANGMVQSGGAQASLGDSNSTSAPSLNLRNDCLRSNDYNIQVAQANAAGLFSSGITGKLCTAPRLIRVNTREIYE